MEEKKKIKRIGAHKVLSDETLKSETKEDLIERIRCLEHTLELSEAKFDNLAKTAGKIIVEQKAEIETLKTELRKECEEHEEFTKQAKTEIERMKERNYWLESEHEYQCEKSYFEGVEKGRGEAVKDTAKEILGVILAKEFEKDDYLTDEELKRLFNERYGVEVE